MMISIPSGAIKRFELLPAQYGIVKFQFLLVRLREFYYSKLREDGIISIPSGAIKSQLFNLSSSVFR